MKCLIIQTVYNHPNPRFNMAIVCDSNRYFYLVSVMQLINAFNIRCQYFQNYLLILLNANLKCVILSTAFLSNNERDTKISIVQL